MPSCSRDCPKVKRDLKRIAAERRKALEEKAGPSGKFQKQKSTDLEKEIKIHEFRSDENPSRSVRSKSRKSFKSAESTGSEFQDSDDGSTDHSQDRFSDKESEDGVSLEIRPCSTECSLNKLKDEMIRRKQNANQKAPDDHFLNSGMNYFKNVCNCSSLCLTKQLMKDPWIKQTIVSLALMAVGVKLCFKLDGWSIPI